MIQVYLVYTTLKPGAIQIVEVIGLVGMADKYKITNNNRRPPLIQSFDLKADIKISDKRHRLLIENVLVPWVAGFDLNSSKRIRL